MSLRFELLVIEDITWEFVIVHALCLLELRDRGSTAFLAGEILR